MTKQRTPTLTNGTALYPYPLVIVRKLETKTTRAGMSRPYLAQRVGNTAGQAAYVVIKVADVEQEHSDFVNTALQREERLLRQLNHPNIVKLLPIPAPDAGATSHQPVYSARLDIPGRPWFIMLDYVAGGSLRDHWDSHVMGKLSPPKRLLLLNDIASALELIHAKGWAHLDVKPENILLKPPLAGNSEAQPVLIDFGIAGRIGEVPDIEAGTTPYLAPERLRTGQPVSAQMDIWALGVIFYQMLTGKHPFEENGKLPRDDDTLSWIELLGRHQPLPPSQVANFSDLPKVNRAVDALVLRMLAKNPDDRDAMSSVSKQLWDINHLVSDNGHRLQESRSRRRFRPSPLHLAGSLVGLVLALFVLGIIASTYIPIPTAGTPVTTPEARTPFPTTTPLPSVTPTPSPIPTATLPQITPGTTYDFGAGRTGVYIPGNQDPAFGSLVAPFFISDSEITNAQYQACVDAGRCATPVAANVTDWDGGKEYDAHPVTGVDAQQALSYAAWAGGRLPTDDEWRLADGALIAGKEATTADQIGFRVAWPYALFLKLVQTTPTPAPIVTPTVVYIPTRDPCPEGAECVSVPPPPDGIRWLDPWCVRMPAAATRRGAVITTWPDMRDRNQELRRVDVRLQRPEDRSTEKFVASADANEDQDNIRRLYIDSAAGEVFHVQLRNDTNHEQRVELRFDGFDLVDCPQ